MAIERLSRRADLIPGFLELPRRLYAADRRWIPGDATYLRGTLATATGSALQGLTRLSEHFIACTRGRIAARVSAFMNHALCDADGTRVGALGFFEAENDPALTADLLAAARVWLREVHGISRVWGPLNFDIWHGYRCMTAGFNAEPFAGEPYNSPYYPELLERSGAAPRFYWNSFEDTGDDGARAAHRRGQRQHSQLLCEGYRFVAFDQRQLDAELRKLHALIGRAFARFPAFTPIDAPQFVSVLRPLAPALPRDGAWFLYDPAGCCCCFAVALLDLGAALRAAQRPAGFPVRVDAALARPAHPRVLFQLIGVTPEAAARSPGLGRALVTQLLGALIPHGYPCYLAPLISRGNVSRGLMGAPSAPRAREYALYEWRS